MDPLPEVVELEGQLTLNDVMRGFRLSRRSRSRTVILIMIWGFIAGVVILSLTRPALLPALAWWLLPFPIVLVLLDLIMPRAARKSLREHQALFAHFRVRFDASGFHSVTAQDTNDRPWESFRFWKEDRHTFVLAESPSAFRIIPKRLLDDRGTHRLRHLLQVHLGKPA